MLPPLACQVCPRYYMLTFVCLCSVTEGLTTDEMRTRLEWWLRNVGQADGEDAIRRRVVLVAANAMGKHDLATWTTNMV